LVLLRAVFALVWCEHQTSRSLSSINLMLFKSTLAAALLLSSLGLQAQVSGNGSSFARELISTWAKGYGDTVGGVSYEPNGSAAGVDAVSKNLTDFGITDVPLTYATIARLGVKQIPLAASGVAIIANLPELGTSSINLDGRLLVAIFKGEITSWDDPKIVSLNRDLKLPKLKITPVWRKDGSGQSFVFSTYLSRNDPVWRRANGSTLTVNFEAGRAVKGGREMIEAVTTTKGAIGYDAFAGASKSGLQIAAIQNSAKKFVLPNEKSISSALQEAKWSLGATETNEGDLDGVAGDAAYPMAAIAYALIPPKPATGKKSPAAFFVKAMAQGQAEASKAGFVLVPDNVKKSVTALLAN
jgi:phosphate transport system substrate-binding protein